MRSTATAITKGRNERRGVSLKAKRCLKSSKLISPPAASSAPVQNPLRPMARPVRSALARCSSSQRDWHESHHAPL